MLLVLDFFKRYYAYVIIAFLAFGIGWQVKPSQTVVQTIDRPVVHEQIVTKTQTQVEYVPKVVYVDNGTTTLEKTDLEIKSPKTELNVTVNGKPITITKTDDEQQVLDKNKLVVTNTSSADLHIEIPIVRIDDTKNWQLGGMVGTDGLIAIGGYKNLIAQYEWLYHGGFEIAAGYVVRF